MSFDQQGYFWLSNPWVAAFTIVAAVGLLLWCHLSLRTDDAQEVTRVPARARRTPPPSGQPGATGPGVSCQVPVQRGRRDANHRRVA
jgi:hypothetical protein